MGLLDYGTIEIRDFVRSPTTLQYEFVKITKEACLFSDEMWQEQSLVRSQKSTRLPMPTLGKISASSSRMVLSSKSPLLSILAPAFVITPRPDVKAVTLALVRGRVPKMPVCPKSLCG